MSRIYDYSAESSRVLVGKYVSTEDKTMFGCGRSKTEAGRCEQCLGGEMIFADETWLSRCGESFGGEAVVVAIHSVPKAHAEEVFGIETDEGLGWAIYPTTVVTVWDSREDRIQDAVRDGTWEQA